MINRHPSLLLVAAFSLAGCAALPDQRLATQALQRGDTATAEQQFRRLAELGYVEAQIGLADLQQAGGSPQDLQQAERTYRQALDQSPRARARLGKLLARKPAGSGAERREAAELLEQALAAGESGSLLPLVQLYLQYPEEFPTMNVQRRIDDWRRQGQPQADLAQILLYRSQGSYSQHLGDIERICQAQLDQADSCYAELAQVYQQQGRPELQQALLERLLAGYRAGSVPAEQVEAVARVLADTKLGAAEPGQAEPGRAEPGRADPERAQALLEAIAPNHPAAWISLAELLYDYPHLGDSDALLGYLEQGREAALPRAELLLGRLYYEGKRVAQDPQQAERHLRKAAPSEPRANYFLGRLYLSGQLGEVYPQQALDHLLSAARSGQANADFALAQMFSQGMGIQPDPVNAYVFGQLALAKDSPAASELARQLSLQLPSWQRTQAERLLHDERQLRGGTAQGPAPLQVHNP